MQHFWDKCVTEQIISLITTDIITYMIKSLFSIAFCSSLDDGSFPTHPDQPRDL